MTILPLLFAGIILLLKKAVFLGKFAMFVTGILGFGNLLSIGQFGGINNYLPHRPGGFGGGGGGSHHHQHGSFDTAFGSGGLSGGYYKASGVPVTFNEFVNTENDPQYADQFYNFEKKFLQNKSEKIFEKDQKLPIVEESGRANTHRNFVWQSN